MKLIPTRPLLLAAGLLTTRLLTTGLLTTGLLATACSETTQAPPPAGGDATTDPQDDEPLDLFRLRNLGKLHADRDTPEGFDEAARALRRATAEAPDDLDDALNLARALVFTETQVSDAGAALDAAERIAGSDTPASVHYVRGLWAKKTRDPARAAAAFRRACELRPDIVNCWFQLGYALEQTEELEDALAAYRRATELDAAHRASHYRISRVLQLLGREAEMAAAMEAFQAIPEEGQPDLEKCFLTDVSLRPLRRADHEPPRVSIAWSDVTQEMLGDDAAGSGALAVDVDGDGIEELLVTGEPTRLIRRVDGSAQSAPLPTPASLPRTTRATAADVDNDGNVDLLLVGTKSASADALMLLRGSESGSFVESPLPATTDLQLPSDPAFVDIDHDGDVDLLIPSRSPAEVVVHRNNGDTTFEVMAPSPFATSAAAVRAFDAHDLDQGNDLDLVVAGDDAAHAFLNRRDGAFDTIDLPAFAGLTSIAVEDLDNDGAPDILGAGGGRGVHWALNQDRDGSHARQVRLGEPQSVASLSCGDVLDLALADVDNDGDLDVVLAGETGLGLLRNEAGGRLTEGEPIATGGPYQRVTSADLDGDGVLEVIATRGDGRLVVLTPVLAPRYASFTVRPTGKRDNASAIGTVVEAFAGRTYQSRMIKRPGRVRFGVGRDDLTHLDGVRLRWPQGVVQAVARSELDLTPQRQVLLDQKAGLVASCPFLYAYGPDGWRFLTDIVGIAPLDEWLPEGQAPHLDPEEWVRIDGDALSVIDGSVRLAVTEELRETTYLDALELVAIDHPADVDLYADESTRQERYGPLVVHAVTRAGVQAARLTDETTTELVATRDGRYLHPYPAAPPQWSGWVPRHELDFITPSAAGALLLEGRIAWYDSTIVYSLDQHDRTWGPLRLLRVAADGSTETLVDDLGVPAGMDRTLVADLGTRELPAGTHLRLSAHHRFLWDRIASAPRIARVGIPAGSGQTQVPDVGMLTHTTLPPRSAVLGHHGFSRTEGDVERHEQTYLFDEAAPVDWFPRATGNATRYGEVGKLIAAHDDHLVVLVAADRLTVEFDTPPALVAGARRTWFLRVSGWAKEGSYHNRTGRTIAPLPFRGMSRYPPPEAERPTDPTYLEHLRADQTRRIRR